MNIIPASLRNTPDAIRRVKLEAAAQKMDAAAQYCGLNSPAYKAAKKEYEELLKRLNIK